MQYQAGYILENLLESFPRDSIAKKNAKDLCYLLSHFDVETKSEWSSSASFPNPAIATLINLIQRGLPTKLNIKALESIVELSPLLEWSNNKYAINIKWKTEQKVNISDYIFRCFHIVDPRLNQSNIFQQYEKSWEKLDSSYEENFFFNTLPSALGAHGDFIIQLLARQRLISSIIKEKIDVKKIPHRVRTNFDEQRTDFSIELPYNNDPELKGIVLEIDGSQHQNADQIFLDTERDRAVTTAGWYNTVRIRTSDFKTSYLNNKIKSLVDTAFQASYIKQLYSNYKNSLLSDIASKHLLELSLTPFAIARIQRMLLEAIKLNKLSLLDPVWNIAVIERDVPCAFIAIDDFKSMVDHLNNLIPEKITLPQINLDVFSTPEFIKSKLHGKNQTFVKPFSEFDKNKEYHLLIDVSVLQRSGFSSSLLSNAREIIIIRSAHFIDSKRKVATTNHIQYLSLCTKTQDDQWIIDEEKQSHLEYFLSSVFRKKHFLVGQIPIIHKALQCKSVIGLLPTGGGKSLTYQLSALLQPGVCLVIDPIRSLMKDQVDSLKRNLIDSCVYINSTLQGIAKRNAMRFMADGYAQFVFVSPERLQMEEFRNLLRDMAANNLYFNYCIVDEAHCVSEWGHDFRTAYLRLGENAIKYCKTASGSSIPLFGLTATASYDVLADVQRELSGNNEKYRLDEDAIIRFASSKRPELQFVIEEVTIPVRNFNSVWDLKQALGEKKKERTKQLIKDIPVRINEFMQKPLEVFNDNEWQVEQPLRKSQFEEMGIPDYNPSTFYKNQNAALVFCPHTKGHFGVTDKFRIGRDGAPTERNAYYDKLSEVPEIKAGFFMGSSDDQNDTGLLIQEESFQNQDSFINNDLNLMVATKAFGMGIDKENIRYTIHVNYPGSIESYVQEAGRAGRDRKMALSYILFNDQSVKIKDVVFNNDLDVNLYFHNNSFKGTDKELTVLDELLTEIYFPDRTFEFENMINYHFNTDVKCSYWEGGANKRLYINQSFTEPLGFINLVAKTSNSIASVNPALSNQILPFCIEYINSLHLTEDVHLWIQHSDKQVGIEELLDSKKNNEEFELTVGFFNNTKERVKTITKWLKEVIHTGFDEPLVLRMRSNSSDAEAFIDAVSENYSRFTNGNTLNFETVCLARDKQRKEPLGTTIKKFAHYYNGYRDKLDTEKAIYRLSTLGIISDYTVNFSSNTFTLKGTKQSGKQYKENLRNYLLKYYSAKTTKAKLKDFESIPESTDVRKCLYFLVHFVYNEIQKKREFAIHDMKIACKLGLEKGSVELKDYIDLYFNSKYARKGYTYTNSDGLEINASLNDITNEGKEDDMKWVWDFMKIVDEDTKASQIDNTKHLRGACIRMLNNQPENYTLLLLHAFTLYMLEFKNPRFLQESENLIQSAFNSITAKESKWDDKKLEKIYNDFVEKLKEHNHDLLTYMEMHGFAFDFSSIMIKKYLEPLQYMTRTIKELNNILN